MTKFYKLYCQSCNWKLITDGTDVNLYEIKQCTFQANIPKEGPAKQFKKTRKFRCPQCGRAVVPTHALDPQGDVQKKIDEQKHKKEMDDVKKDWLI